MCSNENPFKFDTQNVHLKRPYCEIQYGEKCQKHFWLVTPNLWVLFCLLLSDDLGSISRSDYEEKNRL